MTISTTIIKNSYSGDASNDTFAYQFKISTIADMQVIIRSAAGAETVKTLTTHYTVTGAGESSGGNVVFEAGHIPAATETVILRRSTTQTQALDLVENDPFTADSVENAFDKNLAILQELQEQANRSLKISRTNTMTSTEFTNSATDRASKVLAFDADGELSVTQELGTYQGTDATTTTAAYVVRDIIKSTTAGQLNNVYICIADSVIGDLLTDTDHFELLVDAYSAASSATAAAASAADAQSSEDDAAADLVLTNADVVSTNADVVSTNADVVSTNADVALTNADAAATAADLVETNQDTIDTAADLVATNQDTIDTAADLVATNQDTIDTAADLVLTNADVVLTHADVVLTAADLVATNQDTIDTAADVVTTEAARAAAVVAKDAAVVAKDAAEASADAFDDVYLGSKSSDPTTDNDGDALAAGMLYYNTTSTIMRIYSGSAWENVAVSTSGFATLAGVETLTNKTLTLPKINEDVVVTSTATELNLLDGVSGLVQGDLTKLAAIDATAAEIDTLDALSRGSIIYGNASAATTVLTKGTSAQVLTSDGTDIAWQDAAASGTDWQSVKTSGFTAVAGKGYPCNTSSSAFTVTLPSSASIGDYVVIADYGSNASSNNITIDPNGLKILGTTGDRKIKTNKEAIKLVYIDATKGWIGASGYVEGTLGLQGVPDAPTIGTATQTGNTTATVVFTAPANNGDATITSYTSTSSPGGITNTLSQAGSGTISVTGLTAATSYTFTVTATNSIGTSVASAASNSITTTNTYSADMLIVAGGGSGGISIHGGGGGAGGYRTSTQTLTSGSTYTITTGGGAAGSTGGNGVKGSDSSISGAGITTITSTGGGMGAGNDGAFTGDGGSGGGGAGLGSPTAGSGNTPSTTPSQGNNGGNHLQSAPVYPTGGGGGAGAVGTAGSGGGGGNGGIGTQSSITGAATYYAGGGGGSTYNGSTQGSGGNGGGGAGTTNANATSGTANTGGGGGGVSLNSGKTSGSGGSGVVILSVPDASYSGTTTGSPTVATGVSGKTILTFTGSGSYTA